MALSSSIGVPFEPDVVYEIADDADVEAQARPRTMTAAMARISDTVREADAKDIAQLAEQMRRDANAAVDVNAARSRDRERTMMLKRQITGMAFRQGVGVDEVAMLAGLLVGAMITGGFGFGGDKGVVRRAERARHTDAMLDRMHMRAERGELFCGGKLGALMPGDLRESLNDWYLRSMEPKMRERVHHVSGTPVPLSVETLGNYAMAAQLSTLDEICADDFDPARLKDCIASYQRQMNDIREMARISGANIDPSQTARYQTLKMTDEDGCVVVDAMGFENLACGAFDISQLGEALKIIETGEYRMPQAQGGQIVANPAALTAVIRSMLAIQPRETIEVDNLQRDEPEDAVDGHRIEGAVDKTDATDYGAEPFGYVAETSEPVAGEDVVLEADGEDTHDEPAAIQGDEVRLLRRMPSQHVDIFMVNGRVYSIETEQYKGRALYFDHATFEGNPDDRRAFMDADFDFVTDMDRDQFLRLTQPSAMDRDDELATTYDELYRRERISFPGLGPEFDFYGIVANDHTIVDVYDETMGTWASDAGFGSTPFHAELLDDALRARGFTYERAVTLKDYVGLYGADAVDERLIERSDGDDFELK